MKYKRVLLVSTTPFLGGGEVFCRHFVKLLQSRFQLSAIVHSSDLHSQLEQMIPVRLIHSDTKSSTWMRYAQTAKILCEELSSNGPAIVILNGQGEAYLAPILLAYRSPKIIIRHTSLDLESGRLKQFVYRQNARLVNCVVSVAEHIQVAQKHFLSHEKNVFVPNWVPQSAVKTPRQSQGSTLRVVYSGRLVKEKGLLELCEGVLGVKGVELNVFGIGPLLNELSDKYRNTNIQFKGFVRNLDARCANADLFTLPSHSEACPQSVLEASGYGLPCLLSDIPAHREMSNNGKTAFLFHLGDPQSIRENLIRLRDEPQLRFEMACRGQEFILKHYGEDAARDKYLQVFESVAA
jgi:glycosyltransferase involved in cell wall biosynthesis